MTTFEKEFLKYVLWFNSLYDNVILEEELK